MATTPYHDSKLNLYPKTHVVILNGFETTDLMLHISCRSKDDDIGTHNLAVDFGGMEDIRQLTCIGGMDDDIGTHRIIVLTTDIAFGKLKRMEFTLTTN
ncbi:hypothetical protein HS088_TW12G00613 [Tripterygium wilfordii]|uniref:Uncharacterized protein n=1 Tax=Tripterygium wilfordii TaxID=458696 RepID=A0A7J7CZF1_TRIWF|nr:hypothetical protein HS088_TW12G00613 [Tripterygium wilfordii]